MFKRSITSSLARILFTIMLFSVISSSLALLTLATSLHDAEAINIAGSLRMQSYRLAWNAAGQTAELQSDIAAYQQSLGSSALKALDKPYVPYSVRARYHALLQDWETLQPALASGNARHYQQNVALYVAQLDRLVLALQHWAELKMKLVASVSLLGFVAIVLLVFWTLRLVQRQVVVPLNKLVIASNAIEQANFHHTQLDTRLPNELGVLARAFARMSSELEKLYQSLELAVKEKTSDLHLVNRRLALLYQCSETLSRYLDPAQAWPQVLELVAEHESLYAIEMTAPPHGPISSGQPDPTLPWLSLPLDAENATLRWQTQHSEPQLMQGLARMLARSVQLEHAQQKIRHLLVMEERAAIARELHDSLAQSLAYLRIQLARLKRVSDSKALATQAIVGDVDRALTEANLQLRELLTTFRLSIEPANFTTTLRQVITTLNEQFSAEIVLMSEPEPCHLDAQKQVQVLQIVREALLNAIRHAQASRIEIHCSSPEEGQNIIEIQDNGIGISDKDSPPGHYGLLIMHERAASLLGELNISSASHQGTLISLRFPSSPANRDV